MGVQHRHSARVALQLLVVVAEVVDGVPCAVEQCSIKPALVLPSLARVARLEVMQCPCCKASALRVVATLTGLRQLPVPGPSWQVSPGGHREVCGSTQTDRGSSHRTSVRWSSPAPCVGAWARAGQCPSAAVPMQRPSAPSASLQTPTGCQYRGAVGHNLLMQAGVWF